MSSSGSSTDTAAAQGELDALKARFSQRESQLAARINKLEADLRALSLETQRLQSDYGRLQKLEHEWSAAFDSVKDLLFIYDKSYRITRANRAYAERARMTVDSMIGKPYWEVFPRTGLPLTERQAGHAGVAEDNAGSEVWLDDGQVFLSKSFPVHDEAGKYLCTIHILQDITAQKRANKAYNRARIAFGLVNECVAQIAQARDEAQMVQAVCRTLVEKGGYRLTSICQVGHDERSVTRKAYFGRRSEHLDAQEPSSESDGGQSPAELTMRSGAPLIAQNILGNPRFAFWRKDAVRNDYAAIIGLPLRDRQTLLGVLCVYAVEPFAFDDEEARLLASVAATIAFGIAALRMRTEGGAAAQERESHLNRVRDGLEDTIEALAKSIEVRNLCHSGHEGIVAELAMAIAKEMGLPTEQAKGVRLVGMLHDIGELFVPADVLNKQDRLTEEESGLMKDHPRLGYEVIKNVFFPWPVAQAVLQHHERHDGSGYPGGLKGDQILLEARIVGVADFITRLAYGEHAHPATLDLSAALAELEAQKGRGYDAAVVDAALRLFRDKGLRLK